MKRKVNILIHSIILIFILALFVGNSAVRAEDEVRINHTKYTVNIGDEDNELQLKMENQKEGDKKPRWVSYNVNVATVDQNGVVTPLRKGKAIISSGIGFPRKTCVVTVVDPSVELNKSAATIYRSDNDNTPGNKVTLTAKVSGATRDAKDIVWSSSNEEVAKVVKDSRGRGVVTSTENEGEAVITARVNGRTASCNVTVLNTALELNTANMQLSTRGAGSAIRLVPTVVGPKRSVTWTSSDRKIATVSGGKVTGKKEGTVIVTAKANGVEATCTVTVKPGQISINRETELLYVTMDGSEVTAAETKELKTNVTNGDAIAWSSSDESIVKVEGKNRGKAKITAVGKGDAVITATCNGNTDTCKVKVAETKTYIDEDDVNLKTKGTARNYTLNYHVEGRNKAIWTSSDTKVVSVNRGKLVGKKAGTATVTVKANGVEDKVRVTVTDMATISLDQKEYTLYTTGKGNTVTLKATVDGANKKVTWTSNASKVAAVDAKGKVTAKAGGRALITATANGVTAKCWVNVKVPKIILDKNELTIGINPEEPVNLCEETSMEIIGESQTATYTSSDSKTLAVNKNGFLTPKKAGNATITIKANGAVSECRVTVSACKTHNWIIDADDEGNRPATCEESGLSVEKCSECQGKRQNVTNPLGHDFGAWTVVSKPTETEVGLEKQVCTRCNEENTRIIPAKNKGEVVSGYKLVWEDDFNGDELNRDDWNVELHDPGWVNAELQAYVDTTDNISVKDGNLVIQAIKDGDKYTSGRINTQNKHDYTYGKFEVRAKVPSGKGFLPAFWMMPTDENYYGQWPKCGEIDVMEVMGQETNVAYSTLHFGEPHTQQQGTYKLSKGDFSKEFHVYACEWDPDEFRFYVDGNLFYTVNDWFTQKTGFGKVAYPAPYDQPFYMILNLAVGGSWVGYPDEKTQFGDNAQLVVDYVRVYQKDKYDTNVEKPDKEVYLREPDESGNYIINGDFAKAEKLPKGANWQLLEAGDGKAKAAIKNKELQITTTNAGELNYSVQIVQADLPLEEGGKYRLSYDAYADEARTMITDISAPDRGYIRYLEDKTDELTKDKQHFEHEFDMKSDSDANGRVEFNLGNQGSTAKVYITNVRLEKAGAAAEDVKDILPDGNYVYNGSFDEGNEDGRLRLAYWDWDIDKCKGASVSVTSDAKRELKVVVPDTVSALDDVVVYQKPIAIKGGKTYMLSFDAYADKEKTIQTTIAGNTYASDLTTQKQSYKYVLDPAAELDGSELRFLLGTAGTTYIDNVCVREDKMILNGDFSSGMTGFEVYVNDGAKVSGYTVDSLNEENAFSIDITDTGKEDWYIQLKQNNIKLEEDKWYKIGFDAKSTLDRKIMYALQRDGSKHKNDAGGEDWTPYSGSQIIDLTEGYKPFSHTFKMTEGTDPETILSISMGAVGGTQISTKHTVVIDNITLEETDPVEIPPVEEGKEMIANGDFSEGDAHWKPEINGGEADISFADGKATYKITNVGAVDYAVKLNHTEELTLEKGASYKVSFKIQSTAARTVKYSFMTPDYVWYGGEDLELAANEVKEVDYPMNVSKDTSDKITFAISMGKIEGEDTPISTIEIDDISVKKIGGTGGEKPEKPVDPVESGTNLIQNGNFEDGDAHWVNSSYGEGKAEASFENGKATYVISNV
ncbi:MAG: family 16 glycosylhydrolase, partial [Lachnospiraceae bacterium]|nr:family 16 glycosylhydrolase [Lachnospiraceae bacterium]